MNNFWDLYKNVFNENGEIKICGRDATIKLMESLKKLNNEIDFGNIHTGFMNVKNIKNFVTNFGN